MKTEMVVQGLEVQVVRKVMKHVRLAVFPPDGRVRVSVPVYIGDEQVHEFVLARLVWIKKQQAHFRAHPPLPAVEMVSGECHYFQGVPHQLEVVARQGRHEIVLQNDRTLHLYVHGATTRANRLRVLQDWYRSYLKQQIPLILGRWQPVLGVEAREWGVKNMKTRWGSCNIRKKRIWLNLQLAQKPPACLEYVVVHELIHLLEKNHNGRFYGLLDEFLPGWRQSRTQLTTVQATHTEV